MFGTVPSTSENTHRISDVQHEDETNIAVAVVNYVVTRVNLTMRKPLSRMASSLEIVSSLEAYIVMLHFRVRNLPSRRFPSKSALKPERSPHLSNARAWSCPNSIFENTYANTTGSLPNCAAGVMTATWVGLRTIEAANTAVAGSQPKSGSQTGGPLSDHTGINIEALITAAAADR